MVGKIMANVNCPRPCKRRLLRRTAESIMLYGADGLGTEVWADALRFEKYCQGATGALPAESRCEEGRRP